MIRRLIIAVVSIVLALLRAAPGKGRQRLAMSKPACLDRKLIDGPLALAPWAYA